MIKRDTKHFKQHLIKIVFDPPIFNPPTQYLTAIIIIYYRTVFHEQQIRKGKTTSDFNRYLSKVLPIFYLPVILLL